ncbi:MAG TPA: permease-like cell division protein FtsX [Synergistales bacterium]|nr:permease-like cell division protein FtsX [Synergistaceae bacterium]MDD3916360.1 permease-like cell division protein FtsX [Synergistaceae bacterium]NLD97455.1 ABC transporter permease [Synergistaceae bacterium]HPE65880.1 permease-like cell division protein FtsX [Synergistales bacterium]HRV98939.1 permease-like cell division protein FtsX [Aminobacteriaceae bacterium]
MASFRYAFRDTFRLLFRHWGLSLLTLLTAASVLYILGFASLFAMNMRYMISRIEGALVVQAYMKRGETAEQALELVRSSPLVLSVRAISPEEALERLRAKLGNQAQAVTLLGENPLPWSLEIQVQRAEHITPLVRDLMVLPSIEEVLYAGKLVERLATISRASSAVSGIILMLTLLISTLVIFNTIRIAIYSRKEEIEVMLLIGATSTYISLPFVIQGMLLGAGGAILAIFGLWSTYSSAIEAIRSTLAFVDIIDNRRILAQFYVFLFAAGATTGWMCSWLAVHRFTSQSMRSR